MLARVDKAQLTMLQQAVEWLEKQSADLQMRLPGLPIMDCAMQVCLHSPCTDVPAAVAA